MGHSHITESLAISSEYKKKWKKWFSVTSSETGLVHFVIWDLISQMAKVMVLWLITWFAAGCSCLCHNSQDSLRILKWPAVLGKKSSMDICQILFRIKSLACKLGCTMAWEIHRLEAFYRHQACLCKPLATPVSSAQVCEWSYLSECSLEVRSLSDLSLVVPNPLEGRCHI